MMYTVDDNGMRSRCKCKYDTTAWLLLVPCMPS